MNVLKKKTDSFKSVSFDFVIRLGFEPKTHSLEGCCSIQLSYRTIAFASAKIQFFIYKNTKNNIFFKIVYLVIYQI